LVPFGKKVIEFCIYLNCKKFYSLLENCPLFRTKKNLKFGIQIATFIVKCYDMKKEKEQ